MAHLNKVMIIGNVGADPDIRQTTNGGKVANIRIATTERFADRSGNQQERTEWHSVTAWDKTADIVERFVKKGKMLFVEGKLTTRKYTDKDGVEKYSTEILAQNIQLLSRDDDGRVVIKPDTPGRQLVIKPRQEEDSPALRELRGEYEPHPGDLPF